MTDALDKLREICPALPDGTEGIAWKHPVWRVGKSMFAGSKRCAASGAST